MLPKLEMEQNELSKSTILNKKTRKRIQIKTLLSGKAIKILFD
jgi:hypothetical protein